MLNVNSAIVRDRLRRKSLKANSKFSENVKLHRKLEDTTRNPDFRT